MKKIAAMVLCLLFALALAGCSGDPEGSGDGLYQVTVVDKNGFIYDKPAEDRFAPGTVLMFHSGVIYDAGLGMYVNGELWSIQNTVETETGRVWEYTFETVPADVVIEFKTIGGKSG